MRTYERRYHARWASVSGPSSLARLGAWMTQHHADLSAAPRELISDARDDVSERLSRVATREPTRRHRKHFAWLLGWYALLSCEEQS